jgi:hypothetical protein
MIFVELGRSYAKSAPFRVLAMEYGEMYAVDERPL